MPYRTRIRNVVISVTYEGLEFNLERLARILKGKDTRYDPEIFPCMSYKSTDPVASFLIFESGKMNCVGANSLNNANLAIKKLTKKLRGAGIKIRSEPKVKVQNIVATTNFGTELDLEEIATKFENTEYEPEVFPGLVFRLDEPNVVILLFTTGEGVCVGAKSKRQIRTAFARIAEILGLAG